MLNIKIKPKKTKLYAFIKIYNSKRFMETTRVLTEEEKSHALFAYKNLLIEAKQDLLLREYADQATTYILGALREKYNFSEIIRASKENFNFGYVIFADSFVTFFEALSTDISYSVMFCISLVRTLIFVGTLAKYCVF